MKQKVIALLKISFLVLLFSNCGQRGFSERGFGYYWTKDGNKVEGAFKIKYKEHSSSGSMSVKRYGKGRTKERVRIENIKSFIFKEDSFVVAHNFKLDLWAKYKTDLVSVDEEGAINLYTHCRKMRYDASSYNGGIIYCRSVVRKEGSDQYLGIATKRQFEKYFIPLIEDDKLLKEKILSMKKYSWVNAIPELIVEYNENNEK